MAISVESCVAHHVGDRHEQQDRVALIPHPRHRRSILAVLADGMGGHSGGALAAEQVVHRARQAFETYSPGQQTPHEFLRETIDDAHAVIRLSRFTSEQDPHSTVVMLMLHAGGAFWGHCGDSRLYHFRGQRFQRRTEDHSYVNRLVREGAIAAEAALTHPHRNVLTSCLGSDRSPEVELGGIHSIRPDDAFLLCSDGLWAYFSPDELARSLVGASARQAAEALVREARDRARGSGDNLSLVIVKFSEAAAINGTGAGQGITA